MTDVEVVVKLSHKANTDAPCQLICVEPMGVDTEVFHRGEKLVVPEEARTVRNFHRISNRCSKT